MYQGHIKITSLIFLAFLFCACGNNKLLGKKDRVNTKPAPSDSDLISVDKKSSQPTHAEKIEPQSNDLNTLAVGEIDEYLPDEKKSSLQDALPRISFVHVIQLLLEEEDELFHEIWKALTFVIEAASVNEEYDVYEDKDYEFDAENLKKIFPFRSDSDVEVFCGILKSLDVRYIEIKEILSLAINAGYEQENPFYPLLKSKLKELNEIEKDINAMNYCHAGVYIVPIYDDGKIFDHYGTLENYANTLNRKFSFLIRKHWAYENLLVAFSEHELKAWLAEQKE